MTEPVEQRDRDWYECVKHGVTPLILRANIATYQGYMVEFSYKFGRDESRQAAFTYLKSHFSAINLEAYRVPKQAVNKFWVRFDVGNIQRVGKEHFANDSKA